MSKEKRWYIIHVNMEAGKRAMENQVQGQASLDACGEEFKCVHATKKYCVLNVPRLSAVANFTLNLGAQPGFVNIMRKWDPRWLNFETKHNDFRGVSS